MRFAEFTIKVGYYSTCDTICYVINVPQDLQARLIATIEHDDAQKLKGYSFEKHTKQMKGVPLATILNWVTASGWTLRTSDAWGNDQSTSWRSYLFTENDGV